MQPTYHAYGGQAVRTGINASGPYSTNNYSDQGIALALGKMWAEGRVHDMPFFLRHHELTPAMVVTAIDAANPDKRDGRQSVLQAVEKHGDVLGAWYAANPLKAPHEDAA